MLGLGLLVKDVESSRLPADIQFCKIHATKFHSLGWDTRRKTINLSLKVEDNSPIFWRQKKYIDRYGSLRKTR